MRKPLSIYQQRQAASHAEVRRVRHAKALNPNEHTADTEGNVGTPDGTPDTLTPRRTDAPTRGWLLAEAPRMHRIAA